MTPTQQVALATQIIESELQYWDIKKRVDVLQANNARTPAQDAELADYLKKLQHDRDVITIWVNALQADGITNPLTLINRSHLLTTFRTRLQNRIDALNAHLTDMQTRLQTAVDPRVIDYGNALLSQIQDETAKLTALQAIIDDLASSGTLAWQR